MTPDPATSAAIFVLPTAVQGQQGPVAGWISTSGWAAAAERVVGRAWVVTPSAVLTPAEVRRRATAASAASSGKSGRGLRGAMPVVVKTAVKDAREWWRARRFTIDDEGPWRSPDVTVEFVWQRHELFHVAGLRLARALRAPSVLFVPATLVWQARQWGVHRPGWEHLVERHGEGSVLQAADLVACGTDVVAAEVERLGVESTRILVTPTGVDLTLFRAADRGDAAKHALGLDGAFVVGWVGSFRSFHAVEQLIAAMPARSDMALLFVGDGPERPRIERLATDAGVRAVFTGTVPHEELPRHLAAMDVGAVLASPDRSFHYSPLKLAEYLAAGVPVVVPDIDVLTERLDDGCSVRYPAGVENRLREVVASLAADPARVRALSAGAVKTASSWAWDTQIERVSRRLRS